MTTGSVGAAVSGASVPGRSVSGAVLAGAAGSVTAPGADSPSLPWAAAVAASIKPARSAISSLAREFFMPERYHLGPCRAAGGRPVLRGGSAGLLELQQLPVQLLLLFGQLLGHAQAYLGQLVAAAAVCLGPALAPQPQDAAAGAAGRQLHLHVAFEGWHSQWSAHSRQRRRRPHGHEIGRASCRGRVGI